MSEKRKALVAEDNPDHQSQFKMWLEDLGWEVTTAGSIEEGESKLGTSFDLFVLDIRFAEKDDGFRLAGKIRKDNKTTPIIFVSVLGYQGTPDKISKYSPSAFLGKPFTKKSLNDYIQKFFTDEC